MAKQDIAERVADELAEWLELRSTQVANAVLESVYRPRVVEPTRAEALAYYRPLLTQEVADEEGNSMLILNEAGKQQLVAQYGGLGYRDICRSIARAMLAERDEAVRAGRDDAVSGFENGTGPGNAVSASDLEEAA